MRTADGHTITPLLLAALAHGPESEAAALAASLAKIARLQLASVVGQQQLRQHGQLAVLLGSCVFALFVVARANLTPLRRGVCAASCAAWCAASALPSLPACRCPASSSLPK